MKSHHHSPTRTIACATSGILAAVMVITASMANGAEKVKIRLKGSEFGNGLALNLNGGTAVLSNSKIYRFKVSGILRGKKGALKTAFPTGSSIFNFVNSFEVGSSTSLKRLLDNPSESLPITLVSKSVAGERMIDGFGKVKMQLLIGATITEAGEVAFKIKDVNFSNRSGKLKGTMVFSYGKVVVHTAPVMSLESSNNFVEEASGSVQVVVQRAGYLGKPSSVLFSTSNDSALAGTNYEESVGEVIFAAGESQKTISIPIIDDTLTERRPKQFNVTLSDPSRGAVLGQFTEASVLISNDD